MTEQPRLFRATFGVAVTLAALLLPTVAMAVEGFVRTGSTLRAGPSADYPRVGAVSRGEGVEVYGCLARATWCDVSAGSDRGWLQGSRIEFARAGRRAHLSGDTALFGLSILTFGVDDYWGSHYRDRPWVNDRRWNKRDRNRPERAPDATQRPSDNPPNVRPRTPDVSRHNRPERPPVAEAPAGGPPPVVGKPRRHEGNAVRPTVERPTRSSPARAVAQPQRPHASEAAKPPVRRMRPAAEPEAGVAPKPRSSAPCVGPNPCR